MKKSNILYRLANWSNFNRWHSPSNDVCIFTRELLIGTFFFVSLCVLFALTLIANCVLVYELVNDFSFRAYGTTMMFLADTYTSVLYDESTQKDLPFYHAIPLLFALVLFFIITVIPGLLLVLLLIAILTFILGSLAQEAKLKLMLFFQDKPKTFKKKTNIGQRKKKENEIWAFIKLRYRSFKHKYCARIDFED